MRPFARTARARLAVLLLTAALAASGASPMGEPAVAATAPGDLSERGDRGSARVLAISVDGLNPAALKRLGRERAPAFHRLLDEGASTLNARTVRELTLTLPNHTSMVTGRRVKKSRGGHGVTWNDDRRGTVQQAAGHSVASIFSQVRRAGNESALFTTKTKFRLFRRSWPAGIDRFTYSSDQTRVVRKARRDLVRNDRDFTFVHTSLPDVTGHEHGFMSAKYLDAVARTDQLLGSMLQTIDNHADLTSDLVVILTSDHGGKGDGHYDASKRFNYRVPFMVWGPGISQADLYDLNPTYRDPRRGRPGYTGTQPIRNGDLANLAADLLGLTAVPGSRFNRDQDLQVH